VTHPRLAAWLRTAHPAAPDAALDDAVAGVLAADPGADRLEAVLDAVARTCRAPAPADLAALAALEDAVGAALAR
jgi:hypothetical protein